MAAAVRLGPRPRSRDLHPAEPVRPYVVLVAAAEAGVIGEEADRDPAVVDAEQLVHRRAGGVAYREVDVVEPPVLLVEAEIVVRHACGVLR